MSRPSKEDLIFKALADARRRRILDLLKIRARTTGELCDAFKGFEVAEFASGWRTIHEHGADERRDGVRFFDRAAFEAVCQHRGAGLADGTALAGEGDVLDAIAVQAEVDVDLVAADGGRLELAQRRPAVFAVFLAGAPRVLDPGMVVTRTASEDDATRASRIGWRLRGRRRRA